MRPPLRESADGARLTRERAEEFPAKLSYESSQLTPLFDHIDIGAMNAFLTKFSGFYNRYYRASTGKQSQAFLLSSLVEVSPPLTVTRHGPPVSLSLQS